MYFEKFYEGAITGIQDPDNTGNDLEDIEDAVLASHDDEVEDATDEYLGDPVEEFADIMYEAEYNLNCIYRSIGVAELSEASRGASINEAADNENVFKNILKWLENIFERIKSFYLKAKARIATNTKGFEEYTNEHFNIISNKFKNYTLDKPVKLLNILDENAIFNIDDKNITDDEYKSRITVEVTKLDIGEIRVMLRKDYISAINKLMSKITNSYKEEKKKLIDLKKSADNKDREADLKKEIDDLKNSFMSTTKRFNYALGLMISTQIFYMKNCKQAVDEYNKANKKKKSNDSSAKNESTLDIDLI